MIMSISTPAAILLGGLIAGTLDIGAAALINGRNPLVILLVIASGLLGKASFQGGLPAALLGLVLQWLMSLVISAIFVLLSNRVPELKQHWSAAGLAYGVGIFVVMNYLVVPLSEIGRLPQFTVWTFGGNLLAMLGFGLLIAFFARGALPGST
ncbi:hypothetical protein [Bradyrhizobium sp.]|jgi:uncharacterized membrane protein YagU involved in acid resistance|uniref:hypothetical protein n=1 Tax=Bradyrhizobium sp. TaxID=376 RepID=UPI002C7356A0|nr:hypothetical protein [Bradyrhizobium sp.]HWX64181.1 hypothetical protein [Bradyrhizobium sp.]